MALRRKNGEGCLFFHRNCWEGRICVGGISTRYVYKSITAKTREEAIHRLDELRHLYSYFKVKEESFLPLSAWFEIWMRDIKMPSLAPTTIENYRSLFKRHISPHIGDVPLFNLKGYHIERLMAELLNNGRSWSGREEGLAASSVCEVLILLHSILQGAITAELIVENPVEKVEFPKIVHNERRVYTTDEIQKLLSVFADDPTYHLLVLTAIMTGLRRSELCGLQWEDYNSITGELHVCRSTKYQKGALIVKATKTESGVRRIILPETIQHELDCRKRSAQSIWIFPKTEDPSLPLSPDMVSYRYRQILMKSDLPYVNFHNLRHTFATQAVLCNIDEETIATLMGHRWSAFSLDTYAHNTIEVQRRAAQLSNMYVSELLGVSKNDAT